MSKELVGKYYKCINDGEVFRLKNYVPNAAFPFRFDKGEYAKDLSHYEEVKDLTYALLNQPIEKWPDGCGPQILEELIKTRTELAKAQIKIQGLTDYKSKNRPSVGEWWTHKLVGHAEIVGFHADKILMRFDSGVEVAIDKEELDRDWEFYCDKTSPDPLSVHNVEPATDEELDIWVHKYDVNSSELATPGRIKLLQAIARIYSVQQEYYNVNEEREAAEERVDELNEELHNLRESYNTLRTACGGLTQHASNVDDILLELDNG